MSDSKPIVDKRLMFNHQAIKEEIKRIAKQINSDYDGCPKLILIPILKGGVLFASELSKHIKVPIQIEYIQASSYHGTTKQSKYCDVKYLFSPDIIKDKNVLIIDDILDSGKTLSYIKKNLEMHGPKDVKIGVLLSKLKERLTDLKSADYVGFEIDDLFVIGYGLDYDELYRNETCIYEATF